MSAPMKKLPTDKIEILINDGGRNRFIGPRKKLKLIKTLLSEMNFEPVSENSKSTYSWREVAKDEISRYGEPGLALKGARIKEGLSQTELAVRLKVPQYNLSKMENGSRPISRKMAMRLAKILKIDYRVFL